MGGQGDIGGSPMAVAQGHRQSCIEAFGKPLLGDVADGGEAGSSNRGGLLGVWRRRQPPSQQRPCCYLRTAGRFICRRPRLKGHRCTRLVGYSYIGDWPGPTETVNWNGCSSSRLAFVKGATFRFFRLIEFPPCFMQEPSPARRSDPALNLQVSAEHWEGNIATTFRATWRQGIC